MVPRPARVSPPDPSITAPKRKPARGAIGCVATHHRQISDIICGEPLENREEVLVRKSDAAVRGHDVFNCCLRPLVFGNFVTRQKGDAARKLGLAYHWKAG